ncbi:MAG TPA: PQQ-dependent sugar dehydrogenase [Chitinophagaceae bacterium]
MTKISTAAKVILFLVLLTNYSAKSQIGYQAIVTTGLVNPIDVAIPPNASPANGSTRIFIAQQNGLIRLWNGTSFSDLVDLSTVITTGGGEQGLLSMTFHPSYNGSTNRDFFVFYTRTDGDLTVARYRTHPTDPNAIDPAGGTLLITPIEHSSASNHNGGDLNFGSDGFLYLTTGDGGGAGDPLENAQNPSSLLGKLLRIDVNATIPIIPTVVDIGLRNPFRWSFDKNTGDAWIGDVGQSSWEEISFKPAGSGGLNFGWDCYEGNAPYELTVDCPAPGSITFPSHVYPNAEGQAVVGGFVYRGTEIAALQGWYIATDYSSGRIFRRSPDGTWFTQTGGQAGISSFGEAPDGTLYAISQFSDDLYKVIVTGALPVKLISFSGKRNGDISELSWKTATEQNTARFRIEFSSTAGNFQNAGIVIASRDPNGSNYSFQHHFNSIADLYYRLVIEDDDGQLAYSSIIRLSSNKKGIKIFPTIITTGILNIQTETPATKLQIISANGALVFQKQLNGSTGTIAISIPQFSKGIYIVQLHMNDGIKREKIFIE